MRIRRDMRVPPRRDRMLGPNATPVRGGAARDLPRRAAQSPSFDRTIRVTSPPSARPFVSRMTNPTITPIGFMLPSRSFSTTSGLASRARPTIGSRVSPPPLAPRPPGPPRPGPLALDARARAPALGDEPVEHLLGRVLRHLARGDHADERRERTRLDA